MVVHTHYKPLLLVAALLLALLMLLPVPPAFAARVDHLYRATVPVSGESAEQLAEGYRKGLAEVLVKVSGDRSVVDQDALATVFDNAAELVEGRQFQAAAGGGARGGTGEDLLTLQFSRTGVNRALAEAGSRVWGSNRPLTLAWVAVQEGGDRGLLVETGEASEQGWSALLAEEARSRGIPLTLPPADRAGDRGLLSEVWGQFMEQVGRASSGLEHDLLAVVRISQRQGGWQASWLYEGAGIEQSRSVSASSPEALIEEMVDNWAADLAARYGVRGGDIETTPKLRLRVDGVQSPAIYAAARRALSQLNPVTSVGAVVVAPDHVVFEVEYIGELPQLQQNIALEQRFRLQEAPSSVSGDPTDEDFGAVHQTLYYRWQPVMVPSGDQGR